MRWRSTPRSTTIRSSGPPARPVWFDFRILFSARSPGTSPSVAADLARRLRRSGLSFVEVVVTLAVVATLGAVVFSNLSSHSDRQRALQTVAMMDALRLSIFRFDSAVGRFPGRI